MFFSLNNFLFSYNNNDFNIKKRLCQKPSAETEQKMLKKHKKYTVLDSGEFD